MSLEPPGFINAGPKFLAGMDQRFSSAAPNDIPSLWRRFGPYIGSVPGQIGKVCYGVCHDMNEESFGYLACVEVSNGENLPEGFATLQLPANRYAVFAHREHVSKMSETGIAIWTEWLPSSGEAVTDPCYMLERYGEDFDPTIGKGDVQVWVSIK